MLSSKSRGSLKETRPDDRERSLKNSSPNVISVLQTQILIKHVPLNHQ